MSVRVALIGYGEVGKIFAVDLLKGGAEAVSAYDPKFFLDQGVNHFAHARATGVRVAESAADAACDATIIISAVTAAAATDAADEAIRYVKPGQFFFDINSASPAMKRAAYDGLTPRGAKFVEGAVMASVPGPRLRVPILGGGPDAGAVAELLNPVGMNITPTSTVVGQASATKLCRSIVIKGLEALLIDCKAAAIEWNVESEVFASLDATFPGLDWQRLATDMPARVQEHGIRRSEEMYEAVRMLADLGLYNTLVQGVADRQRVYAVSFANTDTDQSEPA